MSEIFTDALSLKKAFRIDERNDFMDYTPFTRGVGFSVQKPYPAGCRYKPPVKQDGQPDTVTLIGVSYEPQARSESAPHLIPIRAKISKFSRFVSRHWDYDYSLPDCPTRDSVLASTECPQPVDLWTAEPFSYDHTANQIVDSRGAPVSGARILDDLFRDHISTVDTVKGSVFRLKLALRGRAWNLCEPLADLCQWLLKFICGRTIETDYIRRRIEGKYRPEDVKLLDPESLDAFGYKASKHVIVTYCTIVLLLFAMCRYQGHTPAWMKIIADNNFLGLAASIVAISLLDHLLPKVFLFIINSLADLRWKLLSLRIKY